jgi:carboxyl-terminal processing protease
MRNMIRLVVLALVAVGSYFFGPFGNNAEINEDREKMIQNAVFGVLEQAHFDPKELDDDLSAQVFDEFLASIDGRKRFLLAEDITQFEPYKLELDDQAQAGSLEFFDLANATLETRIDEVEAIYKEILSKPFDLKIDESYEFDPEKKDFPKDLAERNDRWRKSLKYEVLARLEDKLENQENGDTEEEEVKTFEELEVEAREAILENYDDWYDRFQKIRRSDRFEAYINSFAHLFDPHTDYYNPKEKQDFDMDMSGKLEGIGARLRTEGDLTKVVSIVPGGPAWKGKELEVDDAIVKVTQEGEEGVDVLGMRIDDVVSMIRGKKGTVVVLTVQKSDGTKVDVEIERDVVEIGASKAKSALMSLDGAADNIGYIHLPKFYSSFEGPDGVSCAADIAKELDKLKENNVNGIILDLRSNGGGSLRDVVDMTGLFIEDGPIVQVKPRDRMPYVYKDEESSVKYDGPVIVMMNSFSASASEILAAALQDYERAVIVGAQSFGKGTVQRFIDLDRAVRGNDEFKPLGEVKITMQKFYRVNGGSTQQRGVSPDIEFVDRYTHIEVGEREYDHSMEWSQIAGLTYDQEVYKVKDLDKLRQRSIARMAKDKQFKLIDEQSKLLKTNRDVSEYDLSFDKFNDYLDARDAEQERFDEVMKDSITDLKVWNMEQDLLAVFDDESGQAKNEDWIKGLSKDIYIKETLAIMADMIKGPAYTNLDQE